MAKLNGPLGSKLRGKVGEVVAAKTVGGDTAIRAYQPVVKNPNTLRQRTSRVRFSATSGLAAMFAKAIAIGYASVAGSMKMYPRNIWVRDAVKNKKYVTIVGAEVEEYDLNALQVSQQNGIAVKPVLQYNSSTHTITATNASEVELAAGQRLGLVVVHWYDHESTVKVLHTGMGLASSGVPVPESVYTYGEQTRFVGFYKIIEASGNDVPTDTIPWKYPSATSMTSDMDVISA